MPADRSEKTLVYRVELDESSVAQSIRTARETVGVGLSQAVDQASNVGQAVNMTASTAMARIGGHLEFMERTRQVLAAPAEANLAPHGMGVMRALGVATGMVGPRFSETQGGLEARASDVLGDPTGVRGLQRTGAAANAALFAAGIGLMFVPGGQVAGIALTATQVLASQGVSTGFDRAINRRMMASSLRQLGMEAGTGVGRDFEDVVNRLDVKQQDAFDVGLAALSSVQRGTINTRAQARDVVVGALTDWKMTGKALEMEKGDALAFNSELWRLGITPGSAGGLIGNIAAMKGFGFNPAAMSSMSLDVMRNAMVGGYDPMTAGNQFLLQSGMISQMMRTSVLSRADLTAAAGFSGPQAEQVAAASQKMTAVMLSMRESGLGRAISAGLMSGGSGDFNSLIGSAGRMSLQQMAEFDVNRQNTSMMPQEQQAMLGLVRTTLRQAGVDPTNNAVQNQLMRMGVSSGMARVMSRSTPEAMGVSDAAARRAATTSWSEGNKRENAFFQSMSEAGTWVGDRAGAVYHGDDVENLYSIDAIGYGGGLPGQGTMEGVRGRRYKGLRGAGDYVSDLWDATGGELWRMAWSDWEFSSKDPNSGRSIIRTGVGRVQAQTTIMTKRQLKQMSGVEARERFKAMDDAMADYKSTYGDEPFSMERAGEHLRMREGQMMSHMLEDDAVLRQRLRGDVDEVRDVFGIKVTESQMMNLLAEKERYKGMLSKAGTKEERSAIMSEFQGQLQSMDFIPKDINVDKLAEHLMTKTKTPMDGVAKELVKMKETEAMLGEFGRTLGSKEKRAEIAKKIFKEGSVEAKRLIEDDKITSEGFTSLISQAAAKGSLNKEYAAGARGMAKDDMSLASAVRQRVVVDNAVDLAKSAETPAEQKKGSEAAPAEGDGGGVPSGLVTELRDLNSNLKNLINSGMIKGKE